MSDPTSAPAPRQRLSSSERRAAIVAAALELFSERGFRGTTTRELAARVGVSEPILYEHFRTKSDLYTAIIDAKSKECADLGADLPEIAERQDDAAFFHRLGWTIIQWYERDPAFVRLLLFSGLEGHELKDIFYERQSVILFRNIAAYIEKRIAAGAIRPMNAMVAARAFFGMFAHYCMSSLIFPCARIEVQREEVVSTMVNLFLHGIRPYGDAQ